MVQKELGDGAFIPKPKPQVLPANQEAWELYQLAASQVIVAGMGEVIGLNFIAIDFLMKLYQVWDRKECFEKLLYLHHKMTKLYKQAKGRR